MSTSQTQDQSEIQTRVVQQPDGRYSVRVGDQVEIPGLGDLELAREVESEIYGRLDTLLAVVSLHRQAKNAVTTLVREITATARQRRYGQTPSIDPAQTDAFRTKQSTSAGDDTPNVQEEEYQVVDPISSRVFEVGGHIRIVEQVYPAIATLEDIREGWYEVMPPATYRTEVEEVAHTEETRTVLVQHILLDTQKD